MAAQRILLIEDEPGARDALGWLLREEGYSVRTADNGEAGLACLHEFQPDTVVCDFRLPDIDGLQVLRRARAVADDGISFIVVTAACGGEAEDALRREADHFLRKPINLAAFRRLLQETRDSRPKPRPYPSKRPNRKDTVHGKA